MVGGPVREPEEQQARRERRVLKPSEPIGDLESHGKKHRKGRERQPERSPDNAADGKPRGGAPIHER